MPALPILVLQRQPVNHESKTMLPNHHPVTPSNFMGYSSLPGPLPPVDHTLAIICHKARPQAPDSHVVCLEIQPVSQLKPLPAPSLKLLPEATVFDSGHHRPRVRKTKNHYFSGEPVVAPLNFGSAFRQGLVSQLGG